MDAVNEIKELCERHQKLFCTPQMKKKLNDELIEIIKSQVNDYTNRVWEHYKERYQNRIKEFYDQFSSEEVENIAADVYRCIKDEMLKQKEFTCFINDDSVKVGTYYSILNDFGLKMSNNHFKQAGLTCRILNYIIKRYRAEYSDVPDYKVSLVDHVDKDGDRYIVMKLSTEQIEHSMEWIV